MIVLQLVKKYIYCLALALPKSKFMTGSDCLSK